MDGFPIGKEGFLIEYRGCGKRFDLLQRMQARFAPPAREWGDLAEVGMEAPTKRRCEAPGCSNTISVWRNGRRVSKATRFCKPACAAKARKAPNGPPGKKVARNVKNVPVKWALNSASKIPSAQIATAPGRGLA
jgi:hypothetical protein